ncbi:hypothetical protein JW948_09570 [bacterium]|nr:hypothetical protein [bacterium]
MDNQSHGKPDNDGWLLFCMLTAGLALDLFLTQEVIMTREAYHSILSDRMDAALIDRYADQIHRFSGIVYVLVPVVLMLKIVFKTLLVQFPFVLKLKDMPFGRLFVTVCLAEIPLLSGKLSGTLLRMHVPSGSLDYAALSHVPLSLSGFFDMSSYPASTVFLMNHLNIFQGLWIGLMVYGLLRIRSMSLTNALILILGIWFFMFIFQWAVVAYLMRLMA